MTRLAEPIVIAQWWKNRGGEAVCVQLSNYAGRNLADIRTWFTADGKLHPGRGFSAEAKHLPRLAAALAKAEAEARKLDLIADDNDNGGDQ
jgi:hypothetical protein